jgi:uncharacterized protein
MKHLDVTVVRVYLPERAGMLDDIIAVLEHGKIDGWTVYRGVAGFGRSGKRRQASLVDLTMDLPVIVEFFDAPDCVAAVIEQIHRVAGDGHVVQWSATMVLGRP